MNIPRIKVWSALGALLFLAAALPATAAEWPSWRGPGQDGVSNEKGLVLSWSLAGQNLVWKDELTGRSTPVIFEGRVCANGRVGDGPLKQEMVACWQATTGKKLWEYRFNVYHTAVPWNRVGWASVAGDPETGYLFVQGVGGTFLCLDRAGKVVWQRNLAEDYGFFSGFGGRTQTPTVDGSRVIVTFVSSSWGDWGPPRHRLFAFDKKTGELQWVATPGQAPQDLNTQSTPVVATIAGERQILFGNADGFVYGVNANTGEKAWGFQVSKLALNTTVVYDPATSTVFAAHSEENPDGGPLGRVVAIGISQADGAFKATEKWRYQVEVGFSSPLLHGGHLYVIDNSANLIALEAATGRELWIDRLGTVGKSSAVWADGKLYATEVNGRFHILEEGPDGVTSLSDVQLSMPEGRAAEIYGSPAVGYGMVCFTAENGIYCLGDKKRLKTPAITAATPAIVAPSTSPATKLLVYPAEATLSPGQPLRLRVDGETPTGPGALASPVAWSLEGLVGTVDATGQFVPDPAKGTQIGRVVAKAGSLSGAARVRVFADLPFSEDFESLPLKGRPSYLLGAAPRFEVAEVEGAKVLMKTPAPEGIHRHKTFIGPSSWSGYTIEADLMGVQTGRKIPDVGLIDSGYTVDLMGAHQQIQIRSWESELRASKDIPFPWQPGVWYHMKVRVEPAAAGAARISVKVWPRAEAEPADWTAVHEDPLGILSGAPGLYGFTPSPAYFDNVRIT
ncbi:MAG TPA: PQQ-like beta-propeller repeat protein, partial [Thermoanaerobaculia bacterium]|nr:PQQ-like beta-propeller repeat protein [Thermoanaerobaculia bacterium]